MCGYEGIECLSLEWTCLLNPEDFTDALHLQPPMYGDINIQFLEQLLHPGKPPRYRPLAITNSVVTVTDVEPPATYVVDHHGRLRPFEGVAGAIDANYPAAGGASCVPAISGWDHYNRTARELMHHIVGDPAWIPCDGTLLRLDTGRSIYLVQGGKLREFQSFGAFVKMGFDTDQVQVVKAQRVSAMPVGEPIN